MLLTITTRADSYIQFMTVLILFVFILAATYLVTKWIAKAQKEKVGNGNLEVIETCRITPNKYVQIIRAGGKYLVIAIGKDEIHMLAELTEGDLILQEPPKGQASDFAGILEKVRKLKEKKKD